MRIRKFGSGLGPSGAPAGGSGAIYSHPLVDQQVPIATSPATTVLWALQTAPHTIYALMRNSSSGGQIIRVGVAPSFVATIGGLPLMPGDTLEIVGITPGWLATSNAAGGVLDLEAYTS